MVDIQIVFPILNEENWKRIHRTMVVIVGNANLESTKLERLKRFNSSINRDDTIKADVFTLCDGNLYPFNGELVLVGERSGGRKYESIKSFAKSKGYTQVCYLESL